MEQTNFDRNALLAQLEQGITNMALSLPESAPEQLIDYLQLLHKWNKTYNLTAIREPKQMVIKHLLDSLSVVPHIDGHQVLDVGTGGGLPGMALAICYPEKHFLLLDCNGKKVRFLIQAIGALKLKNVTALQSRVELLDREEGFAPKWSGSAAAGFDNIVSRAFASLQDMIDGCHKLIAKDGVYLAMKGQYPEEELSQLPADCKLVSSSELNVPELGEARHILRISQQHSG